MASDLPPLDLGSLRAAVASFADALSVVGSPEFDTLDAAWRNTLIAGVVQHFQFTFELSWKMLRRELAREVMTPSELDAVNYKDLFRLGFERGLVADVEPWFEFRELRNITAHAYAQSKAHAVAQRSSALLAHATELLSRLEMRNRA